MDLEKLTKAQIVMLTLLVSFFTSLVTGIVTVTLVNQAPPTVTQTVGKVIEKTVEIIERVVPGESSVVAPSTPTPSQEDLVVSVVESASDAVVSVVASKDIPIIEQYFVNPFESDEFFNNLPGGLVPDIKIPQYRQNGTEKKQVSGGTGFFVSADGLIVTNKHVVADTEAEYSILLNDGRKFDAKVLGRDPYQDVAILKVEGENFTHIVLGDSNNIKVGQTVIAIGNTLGEFQNTVSVGIISGLNRTVIASGSLSGPEKLQELIQTDAAINRGNSGGPLLDLDSRVIGINTAMAQSAENVGFALTINIVKRDIEDVKEFGKIMYPFIGIRYQFINSQVQEEKEFPVDYGLLLVKGPEGELAVVKDGPAEKAGLQEGDIVLEINGSKLNTKDDFMKILGKLRVGDKIPLKIVRDKGEMDLELVLEERPEGM